MHCDNILDVLCSALREGYSAGNLTLWEGMLTACLVSGMSAWILSISLALWGLKPGRFANAEQQINYSLLALFFTPCCLFAVEMWMPVTLDRVAG